MISQTNSLGVDGEGDEWIVMTRPPIEAEGILVELTVTFVMAEMVALKASLVVVGVRVTERGTAMMTSPVHFNMFHPL